jgi:hypothetical protein
MGLPSQEKGPTVVASLASNFDRKLNEGYGA